MNGSIKDTNEFHVTSVSYLVHCEVEGVARQLDEATTPYLFLRIGET